MRSHVLRFILCRMRKLPGGVGEQWSWVPHRYTGPAVSYVQGNHAGWAQRLLPPPLRTILTDSNLFSRHFLWLLFRCDSLCQQSNGCDNSSSKFRTFLPRMSVGNGMKGRTKLWDTWLLGKTGLPLLLKDVSSLACPSSGAPADTYSGGDHQQLSGSPPVCRPHCRLNMPRIQKWL